MNFESRRQLSSRGQMDLALGWLGHLCLIGGVLALGYVGFVLLEARLFQAYEGWKFQQQLDDLTPSISHDENLELIGSYLPPATADLAKARKLPPPAVEGSLLGRIQISAIGLEVMVLEGIGKQTLRRAVGHIPGTSLPGQTGNVAIAGHRDTFFRPLRDIRQEDEITLTTLQGSHLYRVDSIRIVEPDKVDVLDSSEASVLTLVTCYPFHFVGDAPQRFIVRARRSPE